MMAMAVIVLMPTRNFAFIGIAAGTIVIVEVISVSIPVMPALPLDLFLFLIDEVVIWVGFSFALNHSLFDKGGAGVSGIIVIVVIARGRHLVATECSAPPLLIR